MTYGVCDDTPLMVACRFDQPGNVDVLLSYDADVHAVNLDRFTPLHIACSMGHAACAKLLIRAGARPTDFNNRLQSALHLAERKTLELRRRLQEAEAELASVKATEKVEAEDVLAMEGEVATLRVQLTLHETSEHANIFGSGHG